MRGRRVRMTADARLRLGARRPSSIAATVPRRGIARSRACVPAESAESRVPQRDRSGGWSGGGRIASTRPASRRVHCGTRRTTRRAETSWPSRRWRFPRGIRRTSERASHASHAETAASSDAARRATERESRRRRERQNEHEPGGNGVRDASSRRHAPVLARLAAAPGSRPTVQSRRTNARRWLQFTVDDAVSSRELPIKANLRRETDVRRQRQRAVKRRAGDVAVRDAELVDVLKRARGDAEPRSAPPLPPNAGRCRRSSTRQSRCRDDSYRSPPTPGSLATLPLAKVVHPSSRSGRKPTPV